VKIQGGHAPPIPPAAVAHVPPPCQFLINEKFDKRFLLLITLSLSLIYLEIIKGVGRKISREGGNGKRPKNSKIDRKISLLSLFQGGEGGGNRKKTEK